MIISSSVLAKESIAQFNDLLYCMHKFEMAKSCSTNVCEPVCTLKCTSLIQQRTSILYSIWSGIIAQFAIWSNQFLGTVLDHVTPDDAKLSPVCAVSCRCQIEHQLRVYCLCKPVLPYPSLSALFCSLDWSLPQQWTPLLDPWLDLVGPCVLIIDTCMIVHTYVAMWSHCSAPITRYCRVVHIYVLAELTPALTSALLPVLVHPTYF